VITSLEKEIGIGLFQCSTRLLEPTETGNVYFESIQPILDKLVSATDVAADLIEDRIEIVVRLGALQDSTYIARRPAYR